MNRHPPKRVAEFDPKMVRDISETVYRMRLGSDDVARMIAKDEDRGEKLRERAGSYDQLTRAFLHVLKSPEFSSSLSVGD